MSHKSSTGVWLFREKEKSDRMEKCSRRVPLVKRGWFTNSRSVEEGHIRRLEEDNKGNQAEVCRRFGEARWRWMDLRSTISSTHVLCRGHLRQEDVTSMAAICRTMDPGAQQPGFIETSKSKPTTPAVRLHGVTTTADNFKSWLLDSVHGKAMAVDGGKDEERKDATSL